MTSTSSIVRTGSDVRDLDELAQQNRGSVLAQLRCAVCLHFVRRERQGVLCENSHYCCKECLPVCQHICSVCLNTTWTSRSPITSLIGEILRDEITVCIYEKKTSRYEGCGLKTRYKTLIDVHEKRCSGRLVTCPGFRNARVLCFFYKQPIQNLLEHMRQCMHLSKVRYDLRCKTWHHGGR